jgi:hypothetical protein
MMSRNKIFVLMYRHHKMLDLISKENERFLTPSSVVIKVVVSNFSSLTCFGRIDHLQKDIIKIYGNHYYSVVDININIKKYMNVRTFTTYYN